jgi:hypothetical protein
MKRKLFVTMSAAAVGAILTMSAAGLANAEDRSGSTCTELRNAIAYHEWRAGTRTADGVLTSDAKDSLVYLQQLDAWYEQYNCDVALGTGGGAGPKSPLLD